MLSRWPAYGSRFLQLRSRPSPSHVRPFTSASSIIPRWTRRVAYLTLAGGTLYILDQQFNAAAIGRNIRTLYTGARIIADYKLNFKPGDDKGIMALHERVAERLFNLFVENGGLYIKIGQALGVNAALLPLPFQTRFRKLFDSAPQVPYRTIESVFLREFGRPPAGENGVFEVFEEEAVASASIAQVHRAKLRGGGENWVAVKVQKPAISKQMEWDLAAYRTLMWMNENQFDLPVYFLVDFVSSHLRLELDFLNEARNAERTAELIASEPQLSGKVYIPKVYKEYTTPRIMTAEYIDGVKLNDDPAVRRLLSGASRHHHPSSDLAVPDPAACRNWDGAGSDSAYSNLPIRGGTKSIMQTLITLFSIQIFRWGFVHCDPHPGNIIIRRLVPSNESQIVLIDHGLYLHVDEGLRESYARLWKGLLSGDMNVVKDVARGWGIGGGAEDLLASGVLLKPLKRGQLGNSDDERPGTDQYENSVIMKERLKKFLANTENFPRGLVFLGRNMRMVQVNNQKLGSPVNRVKIIGHWASHSLATEPHLSITARLVGYLRHLTFFTMMLTLDVAFWVSKLRQWARGGEGGSFEDELEQGMRNYSKKILGVELGEDVFDG